MKNNLKTNFLKKICITALASTFSICVYADPIYQISYKGFDIWLDCTTKSAIQWKFVAGKDMANYERYNRFFRDPNLPNKCQQTSVSTYKTGKGKIKYHRGHLVPANVMDNSDLSIKQSNIMTNVLPQVAQMNTGAWLRTEQYVECRRDKANITVVGGVYTGNTPEDGDFMITHGIKAPEAFWKIAYFGNEVIAWWVPNSPNATASKIDDYIVTPAEIEEKIGHEIDIPVFFKNKKPLKTNALTSDCNRS
ncbi:DNA/RNA non-specific endonuclease [Aliivibrio fischeri]|uniref:DNA/RNA non-specific endonuclease n=1 Tax=Aliivibrio fischeri (strain MJ11) TaxID=388396 RepID=B5EW91_ALIFM|nr:DNA/RNA non-specific endonuclease [Aliivibrio fischeri]ACH64760.1 DNA/RNA non-specific endonuclease [Aliivibrio fischeri MJ11]MUK37585.1 DNA/RNA non-specific endonuclease [Aliivibrio fischeri]